MNFAKTKNKSGFRLISAAIIVCFCLNQIILPSTVRAQTLPTAPLSSSINLPVSSSMMHLSPSFNPPILQGVKVFEDNPLKFEFILDAGDDNIQGSDLKDEAQRLIKYFLASLTVPEKEMWVNLSPYEKDRIVPQSLGITDMGRDMLSQDYILKQMMASLIYPEEGLGKKFWEDIYKKAYEKYGVTNIPTDIFNKVWILPQEAEVYVNKTTAFVTKAKLKVMLEEDLKSSKERPKDLTADHALLTTVFKEIIIPALEKEVNEGQHFAKLRQVYNSLILATWFKRNLKDSLLSRIYVDTNKIAGVDIEDKTAKDKIYQQYLQSFKQGIYNYIKEDYDPVTQEIIPRKYFSGGITWMMDSAYHQTENPVGIAALKGGNKYRIINELDPRTGDVDTPEMRGVDRAIFNFGNKPDGVDLAQYISYRKIFRAENTNGKSLGDAKTFISDPKRFKKVIESEAKDLESAKIDFLITRQAPIEQSVLELVSNAADAITGRTSPIGRFGMGALQMLAFVLDKNNTPLLAGTHIVVETKTADSSARKVTFFKGGDGRIKFDMQDSLRKSKGTSIQIKFPQGLEEKFQQDLLIFLKERLNLFTKMKVNLNGTLLNTLDDHVYLNGDIVRYENPTQTVNVNISKNEITVEDTGSGMNDDVILDKYLIPRLGENQNRTSQVKEDIAKEVHIFYKAPKSVIEKTTSRIVFQVSGINIQSEEIEGFGLPAELVIQLPSSTQMTLSRDKIEIDDSTYDAVRILAQKIDERQPIHQVSLMNGMMEALRALDEKSRPIDATESLVDTAKEVFIPYVMKQQGLILPNDELFRQLDVPAETMFLDKDITYKITPEQIPGVKDISEHFEPGTLKRAFTVPFKAGSKVTYLEAENYLLLNEAIYEKFKDIPMFLNIRLNFSVRYGSPQKSKGTILGPTEKKKESPKADVKIDSIIKNYPLVYEILNNNGLMHAMRGFFDMHNIDWALFSNEMFDEDTKKDLGDISEEHMYTMLNVMNDFIKTIPQNIRAQIDWGEFLFGERKIGEKEFKDVLSAKNLRIFLTRPQNIILPDETFLAVNNSYFTNQDHPERIVRYLENLLKGGDLKRFMDVTQTVEKENPVTYRETIHKLLSQLNPKAFDVIDEEVLAYIAEVLKNKNLEGWEKVFDGINRAVEFTEGEVMKRVILRWLRIYKNDPKAIDILQEALEKQYKREDKEEILNDERPSGFQFPEKSFAYDKFEYFEEAQFPAEFQYQGNQFGFIKGDNVYTFVYLDKKKNSVEKINGLKVASMIYLAPFQENSFQHLFMVQAHADDSFMETYIFDLEKNWFKPVDKYDFGSKNLKNPKFSFKLASFKFNGQPVVMTKAKDDNDVTSVKFLGFDTEAADLEQLPFDVLPYESEEFWNEEITLENNELKSFGAAGGDVIEITKKINEETRGRDLFTVDGLQNGDKIQLINKDEQGQSIYAVISKNEKSGDKDLRFFIHSGVNHGADELAADLLFAYQDTEKLQVLIEGPDPIMAINKGTDVMIVRLNSKTKTFDVLKTLKGNGFFYNKDSQLFSLTDSRITVTSLQVLDLKNIIKPPEPSPEDFRLPEKSFKSSEFEFASDIQFPVGFQYQGEQYGFVHNLKGYIFVRLNKEKNVTENLNIGNFNIPSLSTLVYVGPLSQEKPSQHIFIAHEEYKSSAQIYLIDLETIASAPIKKIKLKGNDNTAFKSANMKLIGKSVMMIKIEDKPNSDSPVEFFIFDKENMDLEKIWDDFLSGEKKYLWNAEMNMRKNQFGGFTVKDGYVTEMMDDFVSRETITHMLFSFDGVDQSDKVRMIYQDEQGQSLFAVLSGDAHLKVRYFLHDSKNNSAVELEDNLSKGELWKFEVLRRGSKPVIAIKKTEERRVQIMEYDEASKTFRSLKVIQGDNFYYDKETQILSVQHDENFSPISTFQIFDLKAANQKNPPALPQSPTEKHILIKNINHDDFRMAKVQPIDNRMVHDIIYLGKNKEGQDEFILGSKMRMKEFSTAFDTGKISDVQPLLAKIGSDEDSTIEESSVPSMGFAEARQWFPTGLKDKNGSPIVFSVWGLSIEINTYSYGSPFDEAFELLKSFDVPGRDFMNNYENIENTSVMEDIRPMGTYDQEGNPIFMAVIAENIFDKNQTSATGKATMIFKRYIQFFSFDPDSGESELLEVYKPGADKIFLTDYKENGHPVFVEVDDTKREVKAIIYKGKDIYEKRTIGVFAIGSEYMRSIDLVDGKGDDVLFILDSYDPSDSGRSHMALTILNKEMKSHMYYDLKGQYLGFSGLYSEKGFPLIIVANPEDSHKFALFEAHLEMYKLPPNFPYAEFIIPEGDIRAKIKEVQYIPDIKKMMVRSSNGENNPDFVRFFDLNKYIQVKGGNPVVEPVKIGKEVFNLDALSEQNAFKTFRNVDPNFNQELRPTGLYKNINGRNLPIFIATRDNHAEFVNFDFSSGQINKIAEVNLRMLSSALTFTQQYKDGHPIFAVPFGESNKMISFALNIETGEEIALPDLSMGDSIYFDEEPLKSTGWIDKKGRPIYLMEMNAGPMYGTFLVAMDFVSNQFERLGSFGPGDKISMINMHGENILVVMHPDIGMDMWKYDQTAYKQVHLGSARDFVGKKVYKIQENASGYTTLLVTNDSTSILLDIDPDFHIKEGFVKTISPKKDIFGTFNPDHLQVIHEGEEPIIAYLSEDNKVLKIAQININLQKIEDLKTYKMDSSDPDTLLINSFVFDPDSKLLSMATTSPPSDFRKIFFDLSPAFTGKKILPSIRTGFAALAIDDDLSGLTDEAEMIARYLKEKDVELIEEETSDRSNPSWKPTNQLDKPVSLAQMNYLYERHAKEIQKHQDLTFKDFVKMADESRVKNVAHYTSIIRSAIEGQDKTQRAWIREMLQNTRDATRRARERKELEKEKGEITMRNFTEGKDWVFSVRDEGVGMDLWHLVRYFFPLDQSSKDYLTDTGNLGQGNYTLFSDFDRVFIRTSTGNGVIHEVTIGRDTLQGPIINSWKVLKGQYKGTEIRRIKSKQTSDPQLESLFIRLAVTNYAGAIQSPEDKHKKGLEPDIRDVKVTYNGKTFSEDIGVIQSLPMGGNWGNIAIGRGEKKNRPRVVQDGIFVKRPDEKELKLVPLWIRTAFERYGGLHIFLPREIQLNIPRTGYSQEHKYLHRLQMSVLHAMMIGILKDYMEKGTKIPGRPPDYFSGITVTDKLAAKHIVKLMYEGKYDNISESALQMFLSNPKDFFELISHIPFKSTKHNGETTLHHVREELIAQSELRGSYREATDIKGKLTDIFKGHKLIGAFRDEIRETVGLDILFGGMLGGLLGNRANSKGKDKESIKDILKSLPPGAQTDFEYLNMRTLKPIVGDDMPAIKYQYNDVSTAAASTSKFSEYIMWNLGSGQGLSNVKELHTLLENEGEFQKELQKDGEGMLWNFMEVIVHESQHLPKFEDPGDHTHHENDRIEGFNGKDDRFGVRMGLAFDELLYDLAGYDDILKELIKTSQERADYVKKEKDKAIINKLQAENKVIQEHKNKSTNVGGIDAPVGGIDFNAQNLNIKTKGDAIRFRVPENLKYLETTPINGFSPVIIDIVPVSLPVFLGIADDNKKDDSLTTARAENSPQVAALFKDN